MNPVLQDIFPSFKPLASYTSSISFTCSLTSSFKSIVSLDLVAIIVFSLSLIVKSLYLCLNLEISHQCFHPFHK
jgi:hypothetical protein